MGDRRVWARSRRRGGGLPAPADRTDPARPSGGPGRLLLAAGLAIALAIGWYLKARSGVQWDLQTARQLVEEMGFWAPGIFVLLVTLRFFVLVPSQVLLVAAGVCFGFFWGTIYGAAGMILSGMMVFGLARYLAGDFLRERVPAGLRRVLDTASRRTGAVLVTIGTAYPVGPLTGYHIGAGLTSMSMSLFLLALALGSFVRAALFTLLGSRIAEVGIREAWPALLLLALFFVPILHPRARDWVTKGLRDSSGPPE